MRYADEILGLARQQRNLLIDWMIDELKVAGLPDALKEAIKAHDELIRVLEQACQAGRLQDGHGAG